MNESQKTLFFRLGVSLIWVAICLSAFWGELLKALLFGIGFGITIWKGTLKGDSRISRKTYAVITGSFGIVVVFLILVFQIFEIPLLTAGLVAGFFFAVIATRWFTSEDATTLKTTAEQNVDPNA